MSLPENRKRARSDDEKEARRRAILRATRVMIEEKGFESLTMNAIAGEVGVSKGTLYLYARNKEELLLAVFSDAMEEVVALIEQASADTLAQRLVDAPADVPLFLPLLARLFTDLEQAVSDEVLFTEKRRMRGMGLRVAQVISDRTGTPLERTREASMVLMLALQGAAQFDLASRRKPEDVPEDLETMFAKEGFKTSYGMAVRLVLNGLK